MLHLPKVSICNNVQIIIFEKTYLFENHYLSSLVDMLGVFYIISITLLFSMGASLWAKKQPGTLAGQRFLSLYFFMYGYAVWHGYLISFGFNAITIHTMRTGQLATLIGMPCSYLYLRNALFPDRLRKADLLHLLPATIFLIDYLPFFLLPASAKMSIHQQMTPIQQLVTYSEGWFMPDYGHFILRYGTIFTYWMLEVALFRKALQMPAGNIINQNPYLKRWIILLLASQFCIALPLFISALFWPGNALPMVIHFVTLAIALVQSYMVLFEPRVFDTIPMYVRENGEPFEKGEEISKPEAVHFTDTSIASGPPEQSLKVPSYFTEAMLDQIGQAVEAFMKQQRPFLQAGYKLIDLSNDTGIGVHKLSAYINRRRQTNLAGYLNHLRIHFCLEKLRQGEHQFKTLEALATESGFQSRTTFIRAFKAETGVTPSEYLEKMPGNPPL